MTGFPEVASDVFSIVPSKAGSLNYGSTDYFSEPVQGGTNSGWLTVGIIITDVVGAGMLSLPTAVAHLGWLGGAALLALLLPLNIHTTIMLWRVYMSCPGASSYSGLVELAFAGAPVSHRDFAVSFTKVSQVITFGGILGIYMLSATRALALLRPDLEVCFPTWALGVCCLLLPLLASMRRLGTWKWPIFANAVSMIMVLSISLFALAPGSNASADIEPPRHVVALNSDARLSDIVIATCSCSFAFASQLMIVEIIAEMQNPAEFSRYCIYFSAPYELLMFLVAGIGGYLCVGDRVQGMLIDYLPFGFALKAAALCLLMNMIVAFCIKGVVTGRELHSALCGEKALTDDSPAAVRTWWLISACIVAVAYLSSQIVPFFVELVDLIGALCVPVLCYGMPIAMYVRWLYDNGREADMPSLFERIAMGLELALTVGLTVVGAYYVFVRVGEQWHLYGVPFDCHCEYIWKTCACSADRPGMEETCVAHTVAEPVHQIARSFTRQSLLAR